jgi:hypothetical protein
MNRMDVDGRNPDDLEEGEVERMLQSDDEGDTSNRSRRSAEGAGGDLPLPPPPPPPTSADTATLNNSLWVQRKCY